MAGAAGAGGSLTETHLRALLAIAILGAGLVLVDLLGLGGSLAGLGLMAIGTGVTMSAGREAAPDGVDWWRLMAIGTVLAALGIPLGLLLETLGGLLAALGAGVVVVGAVLGFP